MICYVWCLQVVHLTTGSKLEEIDSTLIAIADWNGLTLMNDIGEAELYLSCFWLSTLMWTKPVIIPKLAWWELSTEAFRSMPFRYQVEKTRSKFHFSRCNPMVCFQRTSYTWGNYRPFFEAKADRLLKQLDLLNLNFDCRFGFYRNKKSNTHRVWKLVIWAKSNHLLLQKILCGSSIRIQSEYS